jgi:hypothetical protein
MAGGALGGGQPDEADISFTIGQSLRVGVGDSLR